MLLSGILLPFVAGCAIAYFLDPPVDRLEARHVPRGLAAAAVLMLFFLGLIVVVLLLLPMLELEAGELARRAPAAVAFGRQQIQALVDAAQQRLSPEDLAKVEELAGSWAATAVGWAAQFAQEVLTSGLALANLLSLVIVTPVVAFFLLRDWDQHAGADRSVAAAPPCCDDPRAGAPRRCHPGRAASTARSSSAWCWRSITPSACRSSDSISRSSSPSSSASCPSSRSSASSPGCSWRSGWGSLQFGPTVRILIIAALFAAGYLAESNLLSPRLVGQRVNLHPVWVIFALLAFGSLFGFIGVLLALPAAAVIGVLVRFALGRYLASPLYDPANRPHDGEG